MSLSGYSMVEAAITGPTPDVFLALIETDSKSVTGWLSTLLVDNITSDLTIVGPSSGSSVASSVMHCESPQRSSATVYETFYPFILNSLRVWRNGTLQRPTTDYTATSPNILTFTTDVASGDSILACYYPTA